MYVHVCFYTTVLNQTAMQLFLTFIIILSITIISGLLCSSHCVNITAWVYMLCTCVRVCLFIHFYLYIYKPFILTTALVGRY